MDEDSSTTNATARASQEEIEELSEEGRARKRKEQADARARGQAGRKGLVIVNTGNGKGKTTAALGLLMRCWGQDLRVVMLQFLKAKTGKIDYRECEHRRGLNFNAAQ